MFLVLIAIVVAFVAASFFISAGLIWLIAWAFDLIFTWKAAFGMWLILLLVSGVFKSHVTVEK